MVDPHESLTRALASIRRHLGMDVAYISEFVGHTSVFREVDAPGLEALIKVGDARSLDDVYCLHILEGRLPELIQDTADFELARSMPITAAVPIGAHMSIPIRDRDGAALGMFCCLSATPDRSLNERDLQVMRVFADMAAGQIAGRLEAQRNAQEARARVRSVLDCRDFSIVYQPIFDFHSLSVAGFEALCRFAPRPYRTPDRWFAEAFEAGLGVDLETAVLERAAEAFVGFGEDVYLSVNASPATLMSGVVQTLAARVPLSRVVVEITEHAEVEDYEGLQQALAPFRDGGARVAVDDAGAGCANLQHIVRLRPDIVKLDMSLTRGIDADPVRQALASAMSFFGRKTRFVVVAEGVETDAELDTLKALGVPAGQGFFLGRPMDIDSARRLLKTQPSGRDLRAVLTAPHPQDGLQVRL